MSFRQISSVDITLDSPAANLALDEALLDACEEMPEAQTLRFWEPRHYFVVLGYANRAGREANLEACHREQVPVLRRCSGGGAVLQGPGCLNYTLILRAEAEGPLASIASTNQYVMERNRQALEQALGQSVGLRGITDLTLGPRKFSGNAQRRKRHALIFHGTFLLDFDLEKIQTLLAMPSLEPDYRQNRSHLDFVTNLCVPADLIKQALSAAWHAHPTAAPLPDWSRLVAEKYDRPDWNLKFP
jgi:lipoate-protein ligase A